MSGSSTHENSRPLPWEALNFHDYKYATFQPTADVGGSRNDKDGNHDDYDDSLRDRDDTLSYDYDGSRLWTRRLRNVAAIAGMPQNHDTPYHNNIHKHILTSNRVKPTPGFLLSGTCQSTIS